MGCGICVELCPNQARRLVPATDGSLPLDLDLLRRELAAR
jgi:ferredoxin